MAERLSLSAEGRLIFAGRALRSFSFGWLSLILALYLQARGLSSLEIGAVFTATMVEDALLTMLLSTVASRLGPARVMALTAPLLVLGGLLLALADSRSLLLVGAVLGTLSPNGQEAGPFAPMEQALLPATVRTGAPVRAFGWYNVFAFLPSAAGAGTAGAALGAALQHGVPEGVAYRWMLLVYAGIGVILTMLYARMSRMRGARPPEGARTLGRLGLGRSRGAVMELGALQALDALGGGFIMQSLIAYWFHLRFGAGPRELGALFFGTSLLSALSFFAATRVAERFGLLNTMVFTHLPSNVLLMLVPAMPSFGSAALVLLARHLLSQMDVPTRQAYTMALVSPEERPAASGLIVSARAVAQAGAPAIAGLTMAVAATPAPFLLAGSLKAVYDLILYFRFRSVPLSPSGPTGRDGG
jgi:MFS family permease